MVNDKGDKNGQEGDVFAFVGLLRQVGGEGKREKKKKKINRKNSFFCSFRVEQFN